MATRVPLVSDQWYHCYNRGVDKRKVFMSAAEYERFLALLYVCNSKSKNWISNHRRTDLQTILRDDAYEHEDCAIDLGAYALMPNHVHFLIRQRRDGGIARFMQKVFTGYTMYFNARHGRTGALFSGTFKAKHIDNDRYLKQAVSYILLNPVELFEAKWKQGKGDIRRIQKSLLDYRYSSLQDFFGSTRPERKIVSTSLHEFYEVRPVLSIMLTDALQYYREKCPEV